MMRLASLAVSLAILLCGAALAAPGDTLVVAGDRVNVRAGPGSDAQVLGQVNRDLRAVEMTRQGEWVQVRLADRDTIGWIHGSLLAAARPAPEVAEPAAPAPDVAVLSDPATAAALTQFRTTVANMNERALAAAGVDLFTEVKAVGEGAVQVTATDAWTVVPESGQHSYMNALFDRWRAAAGDGQPLRLQVVDQTGQVLMEQSGP